MLNEPVDLQELQQPTVIHGTLRIGEFLLVKLSFIVGRIIVVIPVSLRLRSICQRCPLLQAV